MPSKIERLGIGDKYGLRVTVEDGGDVKFTITSGGGKKQHANATLHRVAGNDVARFILSNRSNGRRRITGSAEARELLARKRES
jgi:hypothetical protein